MQTQQRVWNMFQQCNVVSLVVSTYLVAALGLPISERTQRANLVETQSAYICLHNGPTRNSIEDNAAVRDAMRTDLRLNAPIAFQRVAGSAVAPPNQPCIAVKKAKDVKRGYKVSSTPKRAQLHRTAVRFVPVKPTVPIARATNVVQKASTSSHSAYSARSRAMAGSSNAFPFGQCTWWANERYHQLNGIFVPWRTSASAANWINRAREFGWHVSNTPTPGSIMVLQPGVQGAYSPGHVGVVERLLKDGSVAASSMNWGRHPTMVTEARFRTGPGVAFISQED